MWSAGYADVSATLPATSRPPSHARPDLSAESSRTRRPTASRLALWISSNQPGCASRAQIRAREMSEAWNDYLAPHPFEFLLLRTSPTQYLVRLEQIEPVPLELPALFGEWLYNLRSALDHVVWASAAHASGSIPPAGEDGLQYPIYDTEKAWKRNLWRLRPFPEHQVEMLHTMQPFNSDLDANFLGWINRLARIDRHRRLAMWTARVAEAEPVFQIPSGVAPALEWGQWVFQEDAAILLG